MFRRLVEEGNLHTLVPLLPLLLNLDNKPYSLEHHFQFEPMFRCRRPSKVVMKTARQVAKTTWLASDGVVQSNCIPNFKTLYITPLFEQIRRLSTDRVRKFIDQSPVRHLCTDSSTENSVLRKTFTNGSVMHFSFAGLDADRTRGLSADRISFDEVQDIDKNHIPVIVECMSHSPWKLIQMTGTPKTPENTIEGQWLMSSQAEWVIPCRVCRKDNFCCQSLDLEKIIGPHWSPAEGAPFIGTVCANPKCRRIINPADGFWVHKYPERRWRFAGYHLSQPIMHIHYSNPKAWSDLLAKREGQGNYTPTKYFNEVLGETCGTGSQLVSLKELQEASQLPWKNDPRDPTNAIRQSTQYAMRMLAIDWGGGGEEEISLTTIAVLGWLPTGEIHVIWGCRLMTPHDHLGEAARVMELFRKFRCHFIAHDYSGAGSIRETFLIQNRSDLAQRIMPMSYIGPCKQGIVTRKPATAIHPRTYFQVDKTRSLLSTCSAIRTKKIRFFKDDFDNPESPGLIRDFLGLVENKVNTRRAGDLYTIQRHAQLSDDFAQAVNIGACGLYQINDKWPQFGAHGVLSPEQEFAMRGGDSPEAWAPGDFDDDGYNDWVE